MNKKEVTAPLQRERPLAKETSPSIPPTPDSVKLRKGDLKALRSAKGLLAKDMVEVVQEKYLKYDKILHSKCEHGEENGIQLRPDAMMALYRRFAPELLEKPQQKPRSKPYRIQARLTQALYEQLQQAVKAAGITVQDLIEASIINFISKHNKEVHHDSTAQ